MARTFTVTTTAVDGLPHDKTFVINARPRARDVPAVAPFTVTIDGGHSPLAAPPGPALTEATFTHDYGWGVVNASASVAKLLGGATAFPEVPDIGGVSWGNDIVRAPEVWAQGYTGRGIVVAVVDSGVDYTHPALQNSIWVNPREIPGDGIDNDNNGFVDDVRGWNFYGNNNDPMDDVRSPGGGHGTHVAGTIAAAGLNDGPQGVAFNSKIMPVRIGPFMGQPTTISAAIRYAANNGANVINLSIKEFENSEIANAISFATSLGAVVVAAAGNDGLPSPLFPAKLATLPGVVSVGAIDSNLILASFSHRAGDSSSVKQVVAPGVGVRSSVPTGLPGGTSTPSGTYATWQGTSMATPHVAGVVALMLSALPNPRASGVRDRVVSALVTTSQQPPALTSTTMASASMRSAAAVATAQRPGQAAPITRPMPMAFQAATPAPAVKPQAFVSVELERAHHTSAARPIAFRAAAATSDVAGLQALSRLSGSRRLI